MKLFFSAFISFNLLMMQVSFAYDFKGIIAATAEKAPKNATLPTIIKNAKDFESHLLKLPKSDFRDSLISDLKSVPHNQFPIEIKKDGDKVHVLGVTIDTSKKTISINGHVHEYNSENPDFEKVKKFLNTHYQSRQTSFLDYFISPSMASPIIIILVLSVIVALAIYEPADCVPLIERRMRLVSQFLNKCQSDIASLEQGMDRTFLDTTIFIQNISRQTTVGLAQENPTARNCEEALRLSIPYCELTNLGVIKLRYACQDIRELDLCLKEFNDFDQNSLNSSSRRNLPDSTPTSNTESLDGSGR